VIFYRHCDGVNHWGDVTRDVLLLDGGDLREGNHAGAHQTKLDDRREDPDVRGDRGEHGD
jgi:hypothetical protein